MDGIRELQDRIGRLFEARSRMHFRMGLFVKIVLIGVGAFILVIAQTADFAHSSHEVTGWTIISFACSGLILLGTIFLGFTEENASVALEAAREALAKADTYNEEIGRFQRVKFDVRRVAALYAATDAMIAVISQSLSNLDVLRVTDLCLEVAKQHLRLAFGFSLEEHWTIGIYLAERDASTDVLELRLVSHDRSIPCALKDARRWPIGVGVGGVAFAKGVEVIVPDLADPAIGSTYELGQALRSDHDRSRYRSVVSVPIRSAHGGQPWGVAIATSDRPGRFTTEPQEGVQTAEALRALASMIELVVKLGFNLPLPTSPVPEPLPFSEC